MKFKLDEELKLSKEEFTNLSDIKKNYKENTYNITYRYKTRTSYYLLKNKTNISFNFANLLFLILIFFYLNKIYKIF